MLITDINQPKYVVVFHQKNLRLILKKDIPIWPYHKSNQEDTSRVWLFLP